MTRSRLQLLPGLALGLALTASLSAQVIAHRPGRSWKNQGVTTEDNLSQSATRKWTLLFPGGMPDERFAGAAVYDSPTNSMIVFGGFGSAGVVNDVLSLSKANGNGASAWTTVIPNSAAGSPAARDFHTAVYDSSNSRMIVFGGCSFSGDLCATLLNDVWVLTNANGVSGTPTWVQLSPAGTPPPGRWGHAAAYDSTNNRMIVYGGDNLSVTFSDVWVLSNANGLGGTPTWTQLSPAGGPPTGQDSPSVVYDSSHNVLIAFAGLGANFGFDTNSVWTLTNANGLGGSPVWTKIVADGAAGSPARRDGHIAVYDGANNCMVVFGGNSNTATGFPQLNDAWVLANANGLNGAPTWARVSPKGTNPDGRSSAVGVYDSANNRLIIYGGSSWDGNFFSVWVLTDANGL